MMACFVGRSVLPKELDRVCRAVKDLRNSLNESQPQFAVRLGTSLRSIARYETSRPPKGKVLAQLEQIALNNGFDEYAQVFRAALSNELGFPAPQVPLRWPKAAKAIPDLDARTDEETMWCAALLLTLRDKRFDQRAKRVLRDLGEARKQVENALNTINRALGMIAAHARLKAEGKSNEQIARMFNLPPQALDRLIGIWHAEYGAVPPEIAQLVQLNSIANALALGAHAKTLGTSLNAPQLAIAAMEKMFKEVKLPLVPESMEVGSDEV